MSFSSTPRRAGGSLVSAGSGPSINSPVAMRALRSIILLLVLAPPAAAQTHATSLRADVEMLMSSMMTALKTDPASVARFYTDDASIMGGGQRYVGREQIDRYWREATMFTDWKLDVLEVGGDGPSPWVRGRSTLQGRSGRTMITEFVGLLKRQGDGNLRFYVDIYVAASPVVRPPGDR
jgi:ketosteroid isomerase-like protein